MRGTNALLLRRPTADEVIAYFRADHRLRAGTDPEVDEGVDLTPATSLADWQDICDLVAVTQLVRLMNDWFGTDRPLDEWRGVMLPPDRHTLGELALFIAEHAEWPEVGRVSVAGVEDPAVNAYFALRGLMVERGSPISDVRPSTPVSGTHLKELALALAKLAPELVPTPRIIETPGGRLSALLSIAGFLAVALGVRNASLGIGIGGVVMLGIAYVVRARFIRIEFGEYATIGDVARAIAARHQPAAA